MTSIIARQVALDGRLFPFIFSEPLVGLAAVANLGMGIPYFIAKGLGLGAGVVTAASYEYGNTFLIVSGLLNMLVAIDAYVLHQSLRMTAGECRKKSSTSRS